MKPSHPQIVDQLCEELFLSSAARERDDNLLFVRERLLRSEVDVADLLGLYGQVRSGRRVEADDTNSLVSLLRLSGIVRVVEGSLRVRNRIYEWVFDRKWITQQMPDAELRRQRVAYRRGLMRAALVAGVIVAVIAGLAVTAVNAARHSRELLARAQLDRGVRRLEGGDRRGLLDLLQAHQTADGLPSLQRSVATVWAGWAAASDHRLIYLMGHQAEVNAMAISRDGRLLATGSSDHTARVWDLSTGRPHGRPLKHSLAVQVVAFSPDRKLLATGLANGPVELWETATGRRHGRTLEDYEPRQLAFSPDGKLLAAAGAMSQAMLWETATGKRRTPGMFHEGRVKGVAMSPDGKLLASLGWDGDARLWHTADNSPASPLLHHHGSGLAAAFSPDGRLLATASADSTARLWDTATGKPYGPPLLHQGTVQQVLFSPNGKWLATASLDGSVRLWATQVGPEAGQPHRLSLRHRDIPDGVAFSPDGRLLATATPDSVQLWETTGRRLGRPLGQGARELVTFSPDGRLLATAVEGGTLLWDVASRQPHGKLLQNGPVWGDQAFSPDGKLLALTERNTLSLWETSTGLFRGRSVRDPESAMGVVFSPDGKRLATASEEDGTVRLWDTTNLRALEPLLRQPDPIQSIAFSPDGKWLATGSDNGTARLWDARTGRPGGPPLGYQKTIRSVAFSPDGRLLVTGSMDQTARIWDLASGQPCGPPLRHGSRVHQVAVSPAGYPGSGRGLMATASWDYTAGLWCLPALPTGARDMELRTWVELGARLDSQGNAVAIPWQQWRAFREELQAIDDRKARTGTSDPWWEWSGRAETQVRRGEENAAIESYSRAIQLRASDWRVWWRRGELYAAHGQPRLAAVDFAEAFRQGADWLHPAARSVTRFVQLQWRAVPHAVGYHVYRASGAGAEYPPHFTRLTAHPLTATGFTDRSPDLAIGRLQTYGVAPLFKGGPGQTVEAPPVRMQVAPLLLPPGFLGASIEEEGDRPGSALFDRASGEITLRSSGADIWGLADRFYFLCLPTSGEFRVTVQEITRPTGPDPWAKAGLMVRESLDPGARHAFLAVTAGNGLIFQQRPTTDGENHQQDPVSDADLKLPITLRLTRHGNRLIAEYSMKGGQSFQRAGSPFDFPQALPQTLYVGLAVSPHTAGDVSSAKFRGLRVVSVNRTGPRKSVTGDSPAGGEQHGGSP